MRHGGGCIRSGKDRRLGEVEHIFGVTFLLLIVGIGLEVDRGTNVVGEALNMEQSKALFTCLYVLCTAVNLSITQKTPDIHSWCVSTSLMGDSRKAVDR